MKLLFALALLTLHGRCFPQSSEKLPAPAGQFTVGTRVFYLTDHSRYDTSQGLSRPVIVQVWYPADAGSGKGNMNYIPEKKMVDNMIATGYYTLDSSVLLPFYSLPTHSHTNASLVKGNQSFPFVFFSPGFGVSRSNYTWIYEYLASHGIIVCAIDHLYEGTTVLSNGKIVDINMYPDTNYTNLDKNCLQDISFLLNQLDKPSPLKTFFGTRIDRSRLGCAGHSFGGNLALEAGIEDKRIRFAINIDGGDFQYIQGKNLQTPALFIREQPDYSPEELHKKGRDNEAWRAKAREADSAFESHLVLSSFPAYQLQVKGTGHFSFSDAIYLMPTLVTRFGGKIMSKEKVVDITCRSLRDFISGDNTKQKLNKLAAEYPEITLKIFHQ